MLRILLLGLLNGVRTEDAVEAICYERQRPAGQREDLLTIPARMVWERADYTDKLAKFNEGSAQRARAEGDELDRLLRLCEAK